MAGFQFRHPGQLHFCGISNISPIRFGMLRSFMDSKICNFHQTRSRRTVASRVDDENGRQCFNLTAELLALRSSRCRFSHGDLRAHSIHIAIGTTADSGCCWVRLVLAGNSEFDEEKEHIKAFLIPFFVKYIYTIPPLMSKESYNPSKLKDHALARTISIRLHNTSPDIFPAAESAPLT
jgi:hypothetical protein